MNILDYNQIVIYSLPRSGTKLLANILASFDYHNYGEWHDVWSTKIIENKAQRMSQQESIRTQFRRKQWPDQTQYNGLQEVIQRQYQWQITHNQHSPSKWTITLWAHNLSSFPFLLNSFQNCTWLCIKRNAWDQLLSWCVSTINQNYDGFYKSNSITVDKKMFTFYYWKFKEVELQQQWILKNLPSFLIPFDDLISGTYNGFNLPYRVNSKDEHQNIEKLITNIDDLRQWYKELGGSS